MLSCDIEPEVLILNMDAPALIASSACAKELNLDEQKGRHRSKKAAIVASSKKS